MVDYLLWLTLSLAPAKLLDDPQAQALFDEAQQAFEREDFATAAQKLEQAYLLEPAPELLYTWAQAERNGGHCESAIDLYEKFIETGPAERMVEVARQNIGRCKESLAATEAATEPEPTPPAAAADEETAPRTPTPPPKDADGKARPVGRDPAGAVLVSLGGAAVITGAVLLGVASSQAKKTGNDGNNNSTYLDMRGAALKQRNVGIAMLAVGGALVVAGALRYGLLARKQRRTDVGLWLDRSGGAVSFSTRF